MATHGRRPSDRLLLVEGETDKGFFEELCKTLNLDTEIRAVPPKDLGGRRNSKEGVFHHLPLQLGQLADGNLQCLGVVVDADHAADNGLGFSRTVERVAGIVKGYGFIAPDPAPSPAGLVFEHEDGLRPFGLWIMPDKLLDTGHDQHLRLVAWLQKIFS